MYDKLGQVLQCSSLNFSSVSREGNIPGQYGKQQEKNVPEEYSLRGVGGVYVGGGGEGGKGGGGGRDIKGNTGFINSSFKRSVSFQTWAELFEAGLR